LPYTHKVGTLNSNEVGLNGLDQAVLNGVCVCLLENVITVRNNAEILFWVTERSKGKVSWNDIISGIRIIHCADTYSLFIIQLNY
jgi:hypothetical protein